MSSQLSETEFHMRLLPRRGWPSSSIALHSSISPCLWFINQVSGDIDVDEVHQHCAGTYTTYLAISHVCQTTEKDMKPPQDVPLDEILSKLLLFLSACLCYFSQLPLCYTNQRLRVTVLRIQPFNLSNSTPSLER